LTDVLELIGHCRYPLTVENVHAFVVDVYVCTASKMKAGMAHEASMPVYRVLDSSTDMATTLIGTPYYMSPELFSNKPYNFKVCLALNG